MRVAVVDDEASCQTEILALLDAFGRENGVGLEAASFFSGEAFLSAFAQARFDLVFMDIFMAGMDGLDAAVRLRELDKRCVLIFLTSSGDHHPQAFSVHAFEYILKPLTRERVYAVLRDALDVLPPASRYIEVVSGRRTVRLYLRDIVSAVTDAHYVDIGLLDGSAVRSRMTIQEFLRLTGDAPGFIAVNKGIVLNADYITGFECSCCVTENGARFPVRVRDRVRLEQVIRDYVVGNIRDAQRRGQGRRNAP